MALGFQILAHGIPDPEPWIPDSKLNGSTEMDPYDSVEILGFWIPYNLGMDSGFHALDSGFSSFTFTAFRVPSHRAIYNYLFCESNSLTSQLNIIFHPCLTGHLSRLAPLVITCSLHSNLLYSSYNEPF